jgi:superfamily II DNA or RNA helicase
MNCKIVYTSQVKCTIRGLSLDTKKYLFNKYSFFVPSARFSPLYKLGRWNGKVSYFTELGSTYISLLSEIVPYLENEGYEIEYEYMTDKYDFNFTDIDETYLNEYVWNKGHRFEGQPVQLFDHQVNIVNSFLHNPKSIIEAATGAGKTLICFALAKQILKYGKMIIVEPSADLTVQTANLFNNLGIPAGIVGLGKREFNNPVIIATWQTINSISKKSKKDKIKKISKDALTEDEIDQLVDGVVAVMCDETHQVKATEIQKIFTNIFKDIPLRWGLTGTIPKSKEDYFPLITALGPVVYQVDSKELQEKEILSHCNINIINMEDKSKFDSYDEEIKYLASNKNKILFEAQLINGIVNTGNTLVLIQRLETGEKLIEELKKLGREAVFLSGKDKSDIRFKNYKEMNEGNNKLIIATSQIASTGLDIPRIFNLVYIDMGKSFVKTIQSIGRGLRVFTDKNNVNIYDICSDTKFSKRHTKQRIEYYIEKQYPWKMLKIENWKTE